MPMMVRRMTKHDVIRTNLIKNNNPLKDDYSQVINFEQ